MKKPIIITTSTILVLVVVSLSMYVLNGCQKNVDTIIYNPKISVSSLVINSSTYTGINGVAVCVDNLQVTSTDSEGRFEISNLPPGDYQLSLKLDGYTNIKYELSVYDEGASLPIFMLKELSPYVTIGSTGGTVEALSSSGKRIAELNIPAGELSSDKNISATNLTGNEVPKTLDFGNYLLGTTISLNSDDENISFENGAQLTFQLPFMHQPGDVVQVTLFNEDINEWENYDDAIVGEDGFSASVEIYHFSTYSANVNGYYEEFGDSTTVSDEEIGDSESYDSIYDWTSSLEYLDEVPDSIDKAWLNGGAENQTRINFSDINYPNSEKSNFLYYPVMRYYIPMPPHPYGRCRWHLVIRCYWVRACWYVWVWNPYRHKYVRRRICYRYRMCRYYWVYHYRCFWPFWFPYYHYPYYVYRAPVIVYAPTHSGGTGN